MLEKKRGLIENQTWSAGNERTPPASPSVQDSWLSLCSHLPAHWQLLMHSTPLTPLSLCLSLFSLMKKGLLGNLTKMREVDCLISSNLQRSPGTECCVYPRGALSVHFCTLLLCFFQFHFLHVLEVSNLKSQQQERSSLPASPQVCGSVTDHPFDVRKHFFSFFTTPHFN